ASFCSLSFFFSLEEGKGRVRDPLSVAKQLYQISSHSRESACVHRVGQLHYALPCGKVDDVGRAYCDQSIGGRLSDLDEKWHLSQPCLKLREDHEAPQNKRVVLRTNGIEHAKEVRLPVRKPDMAIAQVNRFRYWNYQGLFLP